MRFFILIGLLLLGNYRLYPQLSDEEFSHISTENGLSNNNINAILQDHKGFFWLGTNDGLCRYDGKTFKFFKKKAGSKDCISGNTITDIIQDKENNLWIATQDGGITQFNPYSNAGTKFKHFKYNKFDSTSIPTNFITTLLEDKNGLIWFGTEGHGVLALNKTTGKIAFNISVNARNIIKLFQGPNNEIWVGRQGGGLLKINVENGNASQDVRYLDFYKKLPHMVITSFLKVEDGHWIGSWDKVIFNIKSDDKKDIIDQSKGFNHDIINSFLNTEKYIWLGGDNGLQLYDKSKNKFLTIQQTIDNKYPITKSKVKCIYEDKNGIVWVGTTKGLLFFDKRMQDFKQYFLDGKNDLKIHDISFYNENKIDFSTDKGIYTFDKLTNKISFSPITFEGQNLIVSKIFKSKNGKTFIGTNRSLFEYAGGKLSMLPNTEKDEVMYNIISSRITDIEESKIDGDDCLITLPYGHYFSYYNFREQKWYSRLTKNNKLTTKFGIKDNLIKDILIDSNKILFSTVKGGINIYRDSFHFNINSENNSALQTNHISQIIKYKNSYIISTYGSAIYITDMGFKNLTHLPLSPNLCEGIYCDKDLLWLISNGNLYTYHLKLQYLKKINLPDKYKSGGITGKIFHDKKGMIYVTGQNYFIPINNNLKLDTLNYGLVITDIKVGNASIQNTTYDKIFVPYDKNNLKFEFSVPYYTKADGIKYSYRIKELNNNWVDIDDQQFLEFYNMNSGSYHLEMRFSHINGLWKEYDSPIEFKIGLPFYRQWWFILMCMVILFNVIIYIYQSKLNYEKIQNTIRNKISQDLHDQVGATLTGINIYSKLAKKNVDEGGNIELHGLLEKISYASQNTVSEINDIVWAINPENDSFEGIVNRMKTLMQNLFNSNNIKFEFNYDELLFKKPINMSIRKNLFLIFRELINNILKHSNCNKVQVNLTTNNNDIVLMIEDNGKGFNYEKAILTKSMSGNGLKNMKHRADENKGTIDIFSNENQGTKIIVKLKI